MIYTVYSFVNNKVDCHNCWQSATEYSEEDLSDKSWLITAERRLANTLLRLGLEKFFSVVDWDMEIDGHGKPRLVNYTYDGEIHINISHSLGAVAVCLSDTHQVGIDVQAEIPYDTEMRLKDRFFSDVRAKSEHLDAEFFTLTDDGELVKVTPDTPDNFDFTDKWAYCESVMKCNGGGFLVSSAINEISKDFLTEIKKINTREKTFSLAISIKKPL